MARLTNYSMSLIDVIRRVAIIFFLWRGALIIVAFSGLSLSAEYQGTYTHDSEWVYFDKNYLLNSFFRWDADWYDFIAREGYRNHEGVRTNAAAFFPLYPLLSRWLAPLFGSHLIAGLFISYASLFLALLVCYQLCLKFYDPKTAERATILILVFPGSFFFSTFYTESLYFFLASASFFYFFKRRYLISGLFGILSCLTRPTGISLLIAMMASIGFEWLVYKKKPTSSVFFLLLMPLGLLIYSSFREDGV